MSGEVPPCLDFLTLTLASNDTSVVSPVTSAIHGGNRKFLECASKVKKFHRFSSSDTPVFGISNGEYFPVIMIMIAGNVATLWKPHTYPQGLKEVPKPDECFNFDEFYNDYDYDY